MASLSTYTQNRYICIYSYIYNMLQVYVKHLNMYHGIGNAWKRCQTFGVMWWTCDTIVNVLEARFTDGGPVEVSVYISLAKFACSITTYGAARTITSTVNLQSFMIAGTTKSKHVQQLTVPHRVSNCLEREPTRPFTLHNTMDYTCAQTDSSSIW